MKIKSFLSDLREVALHCNHRGWDGSRAHRVTKAHRIKAKEFIKTFPENLPRPHVGADPGGCVLFDWSIAIDRIAFAKAELDGTVRFDWMNGEDAGRGSFRITDGFDLRLFHVVKEICS